MSRSGKGISNKNKKTGRRMWIGIAQLVFGTQVVCDGKCVLIVVGSISIVGTSDVFGTGWVIWVGNWLLFLVVFWSDG